MRFVSAALTILLPGMAMTLAAVPAPSATPHAEVNVPADVAKEPSVHDLIVNLSSEQYQVREEATQKLWAKGDAALDALKIAAAGDDPEAAFRATNLIRNIELYITPQSDPEVIELVEDYKKAHRDKKGDILTKISQKRGWLQILKLYAAEEDVSLKEDLRDQAYAAAIIGAREKISSGNDAEGKQLLELAPRDARSLLALACFYRSKGQLNQEIEKATGKGPADWQTALARAAGDTAKASSAAIASGDEKLAAAMQLFNGEFLPWLEISRRTEEDAGKKLYMQIIAEKWSPTPSEKRISEALTKLTREVTEAKDEESRRNAASLLFLLGRPKLAEIWLTDMPSEYAVEYYSSTDQFDEVLKKLELDPKNPDYAGWVEKKFSVFLDEKRKEDDQAETDSTKAQGDLLRLAQFLSKLGLKSELESAFEKPLLAMKEEDQEDFLKFITSLFYAERGPTNAAVMAQKVGTKWAGEDAAKWRQLIEASMHEDEFATQWWDWMALLAPESKLEDRYEGLLSLFDAVPDPKQTRRHWLDLAWKAIDGMAEPQRAPYLRMISYISDYALNAGRWADMETAIKVEDLSSPEDRKDRSPLQNYLGLSMQGRWNDLVEIFNSLTTSEKANVSRPQYRAYLAACLRKLGREEEAKEQDAWVEKLYLGDTGASAEIANAYAFGSDDQRSNVWLRRFAVEASPSLDQYEEKIIDAYSVRLLEEGKWKESAALAEAVALSSDSRDNALIFAGYMAFRLRADLPHALSLLATDRPRALEMLKACHTMFPDGGQLADHFFPSMRKAGLIKEHDDFFNTSWQITTSRLTRFPEAEQMLNTAAWMAARAMRKLPEAETYSTKALKLNPDQAAYLDTMGEIHFAKRDRKGAIKWSSQAVNFAPFDSMIRQQYERFSKGAFPEP